MRTAVAVAVACALLTGLSVAADVQASIRREVSIPAGGLGPALRALSDERKIHFVFVAGDVHNLRTPGASGNLTIDEALHQLLSGTGLTYRYIDDQTVSILPLMAPPSVPASSGATSATPFTTFEEQGAAEPAAEHRRSSFWQRFRLAQVDQASQPASTSSGDTEQRLTLEEIVVTAQKRVERLQDVPVPVSTLSGERLTRNSQLRIEDYYRTIPGLSIQPQGNNGETALAIRGIAAIGKSNPTVGLVVDEISYGASVVTGPNAVTAADIDPGDVARVEVLRGPQGTLYGAASIGGLLKFVTVDPSTEGFNGRVQMGTTSVQSSSGLGHSVRGNLNIPLGETFAVRASGFTIHDPGYIDNVETGKRDVNDRDSDGGRLSALWRPSDDWSVKLSAQVQTSERGGVIDSDTRLGEFKQQVLTGSGVYDRESDAYSATVVGRLGSADLTSATGYSKDETYHTLEITAFAGPGGVADSFFPGANRGLTRVDRDVEKFSQELRASLPLGERVNWLIGAFYTNEEVELFADTLATDSSGLVFGTLAFNDYGSTDQSGPATYEDTALFTTFTIDLSPRWDVQLGGRFSENSQVLPATIGGPLIGALFPTNPYSTPYAKADDSAFTYLVTPRFNLSPNLMLYARLASGYRPGGINIACGRPGVPCAYDSDTSRNAEVGMKGSTTDGKWSFDASAYRVKWSDIQLADLITSDFLFFYTVNAPAATSDGVELSFDAKLSSALKVSAWVTVSDAKLDEALEFSSFGLAGQAGDRLPFAPRVTSSLSLDWRFLMGTAAGSLGATISYVGERKGGMKQFGFFPTDPIAAREHYPAYTQLDLYASATFGSWDVNVFINNATDERGILRNGSDYGNPVEYVMFTKPRTLGVLLSKSF